MSKTTPATVALNKAGAAFTIHTYDYAPGAERVGLQAAEALGEPASRVLKTLMVEVDGKAACVMVASDQELSMKKVAAAFGGKSARMMARDVAERLTGYKVGGISPFGQRKAGRYALDLAALSEGYVYVNGGQRGLQVRLSPVDVQAALGAVTAELVA